MSHEGYGERTDCFGCEHIVTPLPWWKRLLDRINPFAIYRRWRDRRMFRKIGFPVVRTVFPALIASELVSVQPMTMPSGSLFEIDYTYAVRKEKK